MKVVHYTDKSFSLRPITIRNDMNVIFNKPLGGLWCSPLDTKSGWKEFLDRTTFRAAPSSKVEFVISTENLLVIDSMRQLEDLPHISREGWWGSEFESQHPNLKQMLNVVDITNFEALKSSGVDAIHLTSNGLFESRFSFPKSFSGWDCESVLIMNEKCIVEQKIIDLR